MDSDIKLDGTSVIVEGDRLEVRGPVQVVDGNWDIYGAEGDFKIGNETMRLKMGVALGGGGAGDCRIGVHGGTNRMILGGGGKDILFVTPAGAELHGDLRVTNAVAAESLHVGPPPKARTITGVHTGPQVEAANKPALDVYQELVQLRNDVEELKRVVAALSAKLPR